jgi:hypothetical protein
MNAFSISRRVDRPVQPAPPLAGFPAKDVFKASTVEDIHRDVATLAQLGC